MKRRIPVIFLILILFTLYLPSTLQAAPADEEAEERPVRIGYMDYGAFIECDSLGYFSGFGVEYLLEISRYTGWTYEYVYDTWPNLLERLRNKEIDFLGTPQKTPERERIYDFADILSGYEQTIIYTRRDNDEIFFNDYEAMDGKKVGLLTESFQTEFFEHYASEHGFSFQPVFFNSDDEAKEALKTGIVDLVAGGSLAFNTDLKVVGKEGSDPFYWMTYKGNEKMLGELNDAMLQIQNNNPYFSSQLMQKFYGNSVVASQPQFTREEAEYISEHKQIRVGCYADAYPISSYNYETGEAAGIVVDIMNMLAENAGVEVTYVPVSIGSSTESSLLSGDYDVFLSDAQTGYHSNSIILNSRPYYSGSMIPVVREGTTFSTDEKNYTAALIRGYNIAPDLLKRILPNYQTAYYDTMDECLSAVQSGSADLFFSDVYMSAYRLHSPYYSNLEEDFGHTVEINYVLSALRSNSELIKVFDTCISAIDLRLVDDIIANHTYSSNYQMSWHEWIYSSRLALTFVAIIFLLTITSLILIAAIQRKAVREMAQKNQELEIANRTRTTFLSNMSHEIRTPLNGIKGSLDILLSRKGFDSDTRHLLSMSAISAEHLSNLVNDLLDMSKLESGKLELRNAYFETGPFVENISEIVTTLAVQKNLVFRVHTDENHCGEIYADRSRLAQICINLLSNSIKYTEEGGQVDFTFATDPIDAHYTRVTIRIEDTGIGMSEEFLAKAFEPFVQEKTSDTRNGTGLGLSITNALITLMDGDLKIESELGRGTKAVISLSTRWREASAPKDQEHAAPVQEKEDMDDPLVRPGSGIHLLLAEDNDINREIACIQAERFGFSVDSAVDGKEALRLFEASDPFYYRIILMDIMMPVMDGLEAAQAIRKLDRPDAESVYIVAMTANAYAEDIDRSMKSGMNTHLSKPFREEDLYRIFQTVIV